jgi:CubicO group peptidase (beta-lactamase class C family)
MVLLTVVPGVIGIVTADWPFWSRVLRLPAGEGALPDAVFTPRVSIAGGGVESLTTVTADSSIAPDSLAAVQRWADTNDPAALIVWHRGRIQFERYSEGSGPDTPLVGRRMSAPLAAMLVGIAIERGRIASLDAPVATWLHEWQRDPRGRITLRQLLWQTSGLTASGEWQSRPRRAGFLRVIDWASAMRSPEARLMLGANFVEAALAYPLAHEPGLVFGPSMANVQLVAVILERATGLSYEQLLAEWLWKPLGAAAAEAYVDRPRGMPAAYCCFAARPRDWVSVGMLLVNDGAVANAQVLPRGWANTMMTGSRLEPEQGFFVSSAAGAALGAADAVQFDAGGRTLWAIPSQQLVILHAGAPSSAAASDELVRLVLSGIRD